MGVGLVVAVAIFVLFPLAALVAARLWRDPPPEKWGIPAERREAAANTPEMVEFRFRQRLALKDGHSWSAAEKAVSRGLAAPPELRGATHALAGHRVAQLDLRLVRAPRIFAIWAVTIAALVGAGVYLAGHGSYYFLLYLPVWVGRAVTASPWVLRSQRRRAQAAVEANA